MPFSVLAFLAAGSAIAITTTALDAGKCLGRRAGPQPETLYSRALRRLAAGTSTGKTQAVARRCIQRSGRGCKGQAGRGGRRRAGGGWQGAGAGSLRRSKAQSTACGTTPRPSDCALSERFCAAVTRAQVGVPFRTAANRPLEAGGAGSTRRTCTATCDPTLKQSRATDSQEACRGGSPSR